MSRFLAVTALALSATQAFAQQLLPGDRIFNLQSAAQGSCPSLSWHIVAHQDGVLSGTIAWDNGKKIAGVSGTIESPAQIEPGKASPAESDIQHGRDGA
jgi:hypothetical protein